MCRAVWQIWWWGSLLLLVSLTGCGYTLNHRLKDTWKVKNGIFVSMFDNHTDEIGAERIFTNALIRELQSRGQVLIVDRDKCDLELHGEVSQLQASPTAHTVPGVAGQGGLQNYVRLPTEIGVNALVTLRLIDPKTHKVVWSGTFTGFRRVATDTTRKSNFQAPSAFGLLTQSVIQASYPQIAKGIMRDFYDQMVEVF